MRFLSPKDLLLSSLLPYPSTTKINSNCFTKSFRTYQPEFKYYKQQYRIKTSNKNFCYEQSIKANEVACLNFDNNNTFNSSCSHINTRYGRILIISRGGMEWSLMAVPTVEK